MRFLAHAFDPTVSLDWGVWSSPVYRECVLENVQ